MKIKLFLLFISLATFSCTKDNNGAALNDSIIFSLNGVSYSSFFASGQLVVNETAPTGDTYNSVRVIGKMEGLPFSLFELFVNTSGVPDPGIYTYQGNCLSNFPECVFLLFVKDATDDEEEELSIGNGDDSELQVEFTKLEFRIGGRLSGTFSAKTFDDQGNEEMNITDGTFNLKISD